MFAQNGSAPLRLAIISASNDTIGAADLLKVEFSHNHRVEVLERTEIQRILREQELSLKNLDALKLGRLLGADGLLTVQPATQETNSFLSVQLIAVKTGVILSDDRFGWVPQDASTWAAKIVGHLEPLLPKLGVLPQDAIPISVVNFHAGVRTTEAAEWERQIFFLTVERLAHEKRLFVLERKRMQSLLEEKEMANSEGDPFWNGKYLLDGTIDPNGFNPDTITINARLTPPGGKPVLIEATGNRANQIEVVNELATKILAALKLNAGPEGWNTAEEANKFFKEAQWNLNWKIYPLARQAAEAAWALGKHDEECMSLRIRTFMQPPDNGVVYYPPQDKPNPEKIEDAIQAARLYEDFTRDLPLNEPKADSGWYKLGLENLSIATRVLQQFNWSPKFYQPYAENLRALRGEARAMAKLLSRAPSVQNSYYTGSRKINSQEFYHINEQPTIFGLEICGGCLWQEKPEEEVALYRELMSSPMFCGLHSLLWFREMSYSYSIPHLPSRLVAWNETDLQRLPKVWESFTEELKNSPDVLLQMEERALRLADTVDLEEKLEMRKEPYKTAYQKYETSLNSAFTNFVDAFVAQRGAFRTNQVDVLELNWGINTLIEKMGGEIVTPVKDSLQNQYHTEYAQMLAARDKEIAEAIVAQKNLESFAKQKELLEHKQLNDFGAFARLFVFGYNKYSREQALELKPLLEHYNDGLPEIQARNAAPLIRAVEATVTAILDPPAVTVPSPAQIARSNRNSVARPHGLNAPVPAGGPGTVGRGQGRGPLPDSPEPPGPEPMVASNIIVVNKFYPLPMDKLPEDLSDLIIIDHQLVENRLVLDFEFSTDYAQSTTKGRNIYYSHYGTNYAGIAVFDPASGNWQLTTPVPVKSDNLLWDGDGEQKETTVEYHNSVPHHTTIWKGGLYTANGGKAQKFDWQSRKWVGHALPVSGDSRFFNVEGKLYAADNISIQQITDDGRGTILLASMQRRPPATVLDSQAQFNNLSLFADAQHNLLAAVNGKAFRWDGLDWRELGGVPLSFPPSVYDGGVIFMADGWNISTAQVSWFDQRSDLFETCLLRPKNQAPINVLATSPVITFASSKPLWELPKELTLPNLSIAFWQSELFLMADNSEKEDVVVPQTGTDPDGTLKKYNLIVGEKFLPKDEYNSALFCFIRGQAAARKVKLRFDNPEGCPPMAGLKPSQGPIVTPVRGWMVFTPKFLICGREKQGFQIGGSEPAGFKPGVWVVPIDPIMAEITSLNKTSTVQKAQQ